MLSQQIESLTTQQASMLDFHIGRMDSMLKVRRVAFKMRVQVNGKQIVMRKPVEHIKHVISVNLGRMGSLLCSR